METNSFPTGTENQKSSRASARLLYAILLGIAIGALIGGALPPTGLAIAFLGDLFLKALLVLVVPLVMASMIVGVAKLGDVRRLGGLGGRTLLYFFSTTAVAVLIGLVLVSIIEPGRPADDTGSIREAAKGGSFSLDRLKDRPKSVLALLREVVVGLVPDNLFAAMAGGDILPLIVFSLVFGAVLSTVGETGQPVLRFFEGINAVMMAIVHLLMWTAPVGVGALIAGRLGAAGGFGGFGPQLSSLGAYTATVLLALALQGAIILPLVLGFFGGRDIWSYARNMGPALLTAFSTASSSATLPLTIEGVTEENKVSPRTASFVLPLGATVNMNGTALYEAVAAVFIAQVFGIHLDAGQLIIVFLTATLAAVGAAGIPEAGLVTMVIVLKAVNLPLEGVSLLLVVDWFLDRCRTAVNVWGDAVGAAVVDRVEARKEQRPVPDEDRSAGP